MNKLFIFFITFFINPFYITLICWGFLEFIVISKGLLGCIYSGICGYTSSTLFKEKTESIENDILETNG